MKTILLVLTLAASALGSDITFHPSVNGGPYLELAETGAESSAVHELVSAMRESNLARHFTGTIRETYRGDLVTGELQVGGGASLGLSGVALQQAQVTPIAGFRKVDFYGLAALELFHYLAATPGTTRSNANGRKHAKGRYVECSIPAFATLTVDPSHYACTLLIRS